MLQHTVTIPQDPTVLALFVNFLNRRGLKASTIRSYLSAIGYMHRLVNITDPVRMSIVQMSLLALQRWGGTLDSRCPVTLSILNRLLEALRTTQWPEYERLCMRALMLVAFFGLFRIGELLLENQGSGTSTAGVVNMDNVKFHHNHVVISIKDYKHNHSGRFSDIRIARQQYPYPCPLESLKAFISVRGSEPGPLFALPSGLGISRSWFDLKLKTLLKVCHFDSSCFKGHSFRIGGATLAAARGFSDSQIRALGRWQSDAFKKYIRPVAL